MIPPSRNSASFDAYEMLYLAEPMAHIRKALHGEKANELVWELKEVQQRARAKTLSVFK